MPTRISQNERKKEKKRKKTHTNNNFLLIEWPDSDSDSDEMRTLKISNIQRFKSFNFEQHRQSI